MGIGRLIDPLCLPVTSSYILVEGKPVLERENGQHRRCVEVFLEGAADFMRLRIMVISHPQGLHVVA